MKRSFRTVLRVVKFSLAVVTVFWCTWLAVASSWHVEIRWVDEEKPRNLRVHLPTIVAYSEEKLKELATPVTCDRLPNVPEVRIINRTWSAHTQWNGSTTWQTVAETELRLFEAYYDARLPRHYIRIIATYPGLELPSSTTFFCQTRNFNKSSEASVQVVRTIPTLMWHTVWDTEHQNSSTPFLLTCALQDPLVESAIVSVVTETCQDPTNAFYIEPARYKTKDLRDFTICVKDMIFNHDISKNLIEWIETNKILGVNKIDIYVDKVHVNVQKVLDIYRQSGFVRLFHVPVNHELHGPIWPRRKDHIVTYNDCLYRNIDETRIMIPLDIDEVIVPKSAEDLTGLVINLRNAGWHEKSTAALIRNVFFYDSLQRNHNECAAKSHKTCCTYSKRDDVRIDDAESIDVNEVDYKDGKQSAIFRKRCGKDMSEPKFTRNVRRSRVVSPAGDYAKSLIVTKNSLVAFNHYPLAPLQPESERFFASFADVQINHYREDCNESLTAECGKYRRRSVVDCQALRLRTRLFAALATTAPCPPS